MNTERVQNTLRKASPIALVIAAIVSLAAIAYAGASVYHLFSQFVGLPVIESAFATMASVGMSVALLFVIVTTPNQNARGLGAILMIAWVLLTLCMVALDSVMRADLLMAPEALLQLGQIIAALLPALALAAVIGMSIALHDTSEVKSAAGASSKYVGFAAKGVAIGASVFASSYFGISRGISPVLAVLCGALLESAFLWSYLALKLARDRRDRYDVRMWSICTLLFGLFIAAVSVETLSDLGGIEVPIVSALGEVGATLYVSAVGLSLVMTVAVHLLTRANDDIETDDAHISNPGGNRVAGAIRSARANAGEVRGALRNEPPRQLPAPSGAMAKDGDDLTDEELRAMVRQLQAERDAERARPAQPAELVGVITPSDTKVAALNGHTKTVLPDEATAGVRAAAVERKARRAQNDAGAGASGPKSGAE